MEVILVLVGSDEDIARFDFCMLIVREEGTTSSPLSKPRVKPYESQVYRNLIYWVWSRTEDQILFDEGCPEYIVHHDNQLNREFDSRIKFFGVEAWKKIARIAVACAGATYSTDDGENIIVKREHIDWASDFLRKCYDNDLFRLREYVKERKMLDETNEAVNQLVSSVARTNRTLMSTLYKTISPIPMYNLQAISGVDRDKFSHIINNLSANYLIKVTKEGIEPTRRFRQAVDSVKKSEQRLYMTPLTQEDSI